MNKNESTPLLIFSIKHFPSSTPRRALLPFVSSNVIQTFHKSIGHFLTKIVVVYCITILFISITTTSLATILPDYMGAGRIVSLLTFEVSIKGAGCAGVDGKVTDGLPSRNRNTTLP